MHRRLREKGWSDRELERLRKAESAKSRTVRLLDRYAFWIIVLAAILANAVISIVLVPLLLVLAGYPLFLSVAAIGICFGFLFDNLLHGIEEFTHHHYILIIGIVPAIAALMVFFMSEFANMLMAAGLPGMPHDPLLVGLVYGMSYLFPFAFKRMRRA